MNRIDPSKRRWSWLLVGLTGLLSACSASVQAAQNAIAPSTPGESDEFVQRWSYLATHNGIEKSPTQWDGAIDGPVTLWYDDRQKSGEGEYKDSVRVGLWTFWYPNGRLRWHGSYVAGAIDGLETTWYESGQKASEGQWKNGRRDGVFTFWHENGRISAQGEYKNGKRQGRFEYFHDDGSVDEALSGRYLNDVKTPE